MIARLDGVSYRYPSSEEWALRDATLRIEAGELTLVTGPSGGGKSTLLRLFNGLVPQFTGGTLAGRAEVAGHDPARTPSRVMARSVGFVFQEPESQAIADTVEDDIAFGMEQLAVPRDEMIARLDALLRVLDLERLRARRLATLSGGERQRAAIAAALALEPAMLVLDEPTSQLDKENAGAVIDALERLRHARGTTIAVSEHRLERLLSVADRAVIVRSGIVESGTPRQCAASYGGAPPVARLGACLRLDPLPLTVEEAAANHRARVANLPIRPRQADPAPGNPVIEVDGLTVRFGEFEALRGVSLTVHEGEVIALVGANGSGKSTLLRAIAGTVRAASGRIRLRGEERTTVADRTAVAGLVPQDPAMALYHPSVAEEISSTLVARRDRTSTAAVLERWGLTAFSDRDPRDVSVGQQERVAIAAMLAHDPPAWMLDEPTRGADLAARSHLVEMLAGHARRGGAAIVATHDIETAARFATRVVKLDAGEIAWDLPVAQALGSTGPWPTQIARLVPGALTLEDIVECAS